MRDLLVRYLLGELQTDERRQLELELQSSAELRRELAYLRACFAASQNDEVYVDQPPSGLAERTVERVAGLSSCGESDPAEDGACRASAGALAAIEPPAGTPSWSFTDLTVAAGLFMAVSMLFLPALGQSREAARRVDCANNLRQLSPILTWYSDQNRGFYPLVRRNQNAGVFAVYLLQKGYAHEDELKQVLVCRSSQLGEQVADGHVKLRIPRHLDELYRASTRQLAEMGGSYAYNFGFVDGDRYHGIRNERSCRKAVMADAPSFDFASVRSANHGGTGQNVLYQDGHVAFDTTCASSDPDDHLFLNDDGEAAAGRGRFDTVLGSSEATPGDVPLKTVP